MNRDKALTIADRIMTRIETDKSIHKDAIADEIQAGDALDEIVDIISHDGEKWVHRDGTPFDTDADVKQKGVDAEIHALLLDAEKRAAKLHAVLTDFTFPRIDPDRLPPVPDIGTIRVQGDVMSMWDGEKWVHRDGSPFNTDADLVVVRETFLNAWGDTVSIDIVGRDTA